jgi:hypothetical protein
MLISLPEWYIKEKQKLEDCIDDIIRRNNIHWGFAHDSQAIEDAKEAIMRNLWNIWDKVDVENRKIEEKFQKALKEEEKTTKEEDIGLFVFNCLSKNICIFETESISEDEEKYIELGTIKEGEGLRIFPKHNSIIIEELKEKKKRK